MQTFKIYTIFNTLIFEVHTMQTIPFSQIREDFTETAQKVQFSKEPCLLTRNNKPAAGLVPIEYLMLISDIMSKAEKSKEISKILEKYMLILDSDEMSQIKEILTSPPKANKKLKALLKTSKEKFDN